MRKVYDSILMALSAVGEFGGDGFFDRFKGWESVQSLWESNIAAIDGEDAHDLCLWGVEACGGGVEPMTSAAGDVVAGQGDRRCGA